MLKDFASDLKKMREAKGISLTEISAETRINPKFLNLLESGVFNFQPETYVRAFLKEYARAIGENENRLLNDYDKAKSGYYAKRTEFKSESSGSEIPEGSLEKTSVPSEKRETVFRNQITEEDKVQAEPKYSFFKEENDLDKKEFSNRSWTQKILLGLLILLVVGGVVYLINYLNVSKDKNKTDVKPKTFNEISDDYENKITGKKNLDSLNNKNSTVPDDSLKLTIKTSKDVRIKVYIDENRIIEDQISAKDSLQVKAKDQFRFSSSANTGLELYLNGRFLKKPASLNGLSIKNIVIKKDGIANQ